MNSQAHQAQFTIYNASAGSGKTYSLVAAYLELLLGTTAPDGYRNMLAITFTNKAVAEMKQRIVSGLTDIARFGKGRERPNLMDRLKERLGLSDQELSLRANSVLQHLLHHYAGFSVETIDGFNHRLIRTFARDLKIASNFEVSLDTDELLMRAVDRLIEKTGEDQEITAALVDFSMQKADDDRSWDISKDIAEASRILFSETERPHVAKLKDKNLGDFKRLENKLRQTAGSLRTRLVVLAKEVFNGMEENGIGAEGFNGKYYPNFFKKLAAKDLGVSLDTNWQQQIRTKPLYSKGFARLNPQKAELLDQLQDRFASWLEEAIELIPRIWFLENILTNLTPLSVINLVREEIDLICSEENILPIAEFNERIYAEIRDQPAPFIYERLGERYRFFFIDEFQDTSVLQWHNLIPLIENALSQQYADGQPGSLIMVGDAKQSIYRWRGGVPEQFIELYQGHSPFPGIETELITLDTNWRSRSQIIAFNNHFFTYVSKLFGHPAHQELYEIGNDQKPTDKEGGYVSVSFIEDEAKKEDLNLAYAGYTLELVKKLIAEGYRHNEICILTRKKDQGIVVGTALMEEAIPVVSSETLLIEQSPLVGFLVDLIRFKKEPYQEEVVVSLLCYLHAQMDREEALHDFLIKCKGPGGIDLGRGLTLLKSGFDLKKIALLSLYESCEYAIDAFGLQDKADACLQGFLSLLLDFENKAKKGQYFLDLWERKKKDLAIAMPGDLEAINIMTIHKAKGLEFPVLIYPFADEELYREKSARAWVDISELDDDFEEARVSIRKDEFTSYGRHAEEMYRQRRNVLELDNINLLYVALTRAEERLYVIGKLPGEKSMASPNSFNSLLAGFLQKEDKWDGTARDYIWGTPVNAQRKEKPDTSTDMVPLYRVNLPERLDLKVAGVEAGQWFGHWDEAIRLGNELHDLMAAIEFRDQAQSRMQSYLQEKDSPYRQKIVSVARSIIEHPEVSEYFLNAQKIENERELLSSEGKILRPDRINFNPDGSLTIIDYKTGSPTEANRQQMTSYRETLEAMGYTIKECLLIYASPQEILINKL